MTRKTPLRWATLWSLLRSRRQASARDRAVIDGWHLLYAMTPHQLADLPAIHERC